MAEERIERNQKVKPLNIEKRCSRHPHNPHSWVMQEKNPEWECYQCHIESIAKFGTVPGEDNDPKFNF